MRRFDEIIQPRDVSELGVGIEEKGSVIGVGESASMKLLEVGS